MLLTHFTGMLVFEAGVFGVVKLSAVVRLCWCFPGLCEHLCSLAVPRQLASWYQRFKIFSQQTSNEQ